MDARIKRSQAAIKRTFLELYSEQPIQKITVTDICNGAGVNRATFYKYYEGTEDLLNKLENIRLEELSAKIEERGVKRLEELVEIVVDDVNSEYDFYSLMFIADKSSEFMRKFIVTLYDINMQLLSDAFPELSDDKREMLYYFTMSGIVGVFNVWHAKGRVEPVENIRGFSLEIARQIYEYGKHFTGEEFNI